MSKSEIEWTDVTWNPVRGCTKISPGCKNCYAEKFAERWRGVAGYAYEQGFDLRVVPEKLVEPLKWRKPRTCFVNSMSDLFHEDVPNEYIAAVYGVMAACQRHTFQVLTKRADRPVEWFAWAERMRTANGWGKTRTVLTDALVHAGITGAAAYMAETWPLPNVWQGVSVEDRKYGLPRIQHLRRTPAAVRFLSIEPLLEDLGDDWSLDGIDWVIVGGESGIGARPMHPHWVLRIRDKVLAARRDCVTCHGWGNVENKTCGACRGRGWTGPAFFFKQWGAWEPRGPMYVVSELAGSNELALAATGSIWRGAGYTDQENRWRALHGDTAQRMRRTSKKKAGRELDGRIWDEMPARPAAA